MAMDKQAQGACWLWLVTLYGLVCVTGTAAIIITFWLKGST